MPLVVVEVVVVVVVAVVEVLRGVWTQLASLLLSIRRPLCQLFSSGPPPPSSAGEGSYGQLRQRFGSAAADELIRRLSLVWISHIHADHHVGLPAVLAARTRLLGHDCPPLLVLGPRPLRRALQGYAQLEPMRFRFVEASATAALSPDGAGAPPAVPPEARAAIDATLASMGLSRFESVLVAHCAHAYGLVLERALGADGAGGWKLVFSGDTRPCSRLVEAAKGATLLIHEVRRQQGPSGKLLQPYLSRWIWLRRSM